MSITTHFLDKTFYIDLYQVLSTYRHILRDCGSSKLYLSVCVCVWLSRFYDLYFGYHGSDFDETLWICWNLGPMGPIKFVFLHRDIISWQREIKIMLYPDCDTSDGDLVFELFFIGGPRNMRLIAMTSYLVRFNNESQTIYNNKIWSHKPPARSIYISTCLC